MKLLVILSGFSLAILIGFYKGLKQEKPFIWKILTIAILISGAILTLYPRVAASISEIDEIAPYINNMPIPAEIFIKEHTVYEEDNRNFIEIYGTNSFADKPHKLFVNEKNLEVLKKSNHWIIKVQILEENRLLLKEIVQSKPWISYPYVLSLDDRIKILNFHVPMAWIAVLAYFISMFFAAKYLRRKEINDDVMAATSASLGTLFAILATVSGSVWAKFNWGSFWNWDPRETSIFILLLIYFAYFALRGSIEREDIRAKASAVYSIIAFVTVPFLVFVLPRITAGLHPGSQGGGMSGPILSTQKGMLDSSLMFSFSLCVIGFTLIFFWMLNVNYRANIIKKSVEE